LTQDAAATAITAAKLTVGTVTQQSSNTVAIGKVISQDPASGSSVTEGSPVNLVISSG
jgi:serine/threonine-protein kinase